MTAALFVCTYSGLTRDIKQIQHLLKQFADLARRKPSPQCASLPAAPTAFTSSLSRGLRTNEGFSSEPITSHFSLKPEFLPKFGSGSFPLREGSFESGLGPSLDRAHDGRLWRGALSCQMTSLATRPPRLISPRVTSDSSVTTQAGRNVAGRDPTLRREEIFPAPSHDRCGSSKRSLTSSPHLHSTNPQPTPVRAIFSWKKRAAGLNGLL